MIFGIIGIMGGILFAILAVVAFLKNNEKAKGRFILSIAFFFLYFATTISFGGFGDEEETTKDSNTNENDISEESTNDHVANHPSETNNQEEKKSGSLKKENVDSEGNSDKPLQTKDLDITYEVGKDLEPGEYIVVTTQPEIGYMVNSEDPSGEVESILFNQNFFQMNANAYVTLQEGEYFKTRGMEMYAAEDYEPGPEDGAFRDGMYKVGRDIDPGEYKVFLDKDRGTGYLKVREDSRYQSSTTHSEFFDVNEETESTVTVADGQYLIMKGVMIEVD